jgi:hypothetical protein
MARAARELTTYIEDYAKLSGGQMRDKYGDDPAEGFNNIVRRARALKALGWKEPHPMTAPEKDLSLSEPTEG